MAEKAQDRLEDRKDKLLEYEYRDRKLGLCLGFSALALLIVSGVIISIYGSIYVGAGLLSAAAIGAAITPFIDGRKKIPQMPSKVTKKPAAKSGE
jgi:galactokinase